jgi:predicted DNA-binding protein (MmcQ/YjbR family)
MDLETFREYCLTKIAAPESMPFGEGVLVFKVAGKMFALAARWNGRRSHSSTRWKKKLELCPEILSLATCANRRLLFGD